MESSFLCCSLCCLCPFPLLTALWLGNKAFSYPSFIFLQTPLLITISQCFSVSPQDRVTTPLLSYLFLSTSWLTASKCSSWMAKEPAQCGAVHHPHFLSVLWAWKFFEAGLWTRSILNIVMFISYFEWKDEGGFWVLNFIITFQKPCWRLF